MKPRIKAKPTGSPSTVAAYVRAQKSGLAAVCLLLRKEIEAALPKATAKIYHSIPVWFIGENPVVGFNVTAKQQVNLLFWNGKALGAPELKPAGNFKAAQIQFGDVEEVDKKKLR